MIVAPGTGVKVRRPGHCGPTGGARRQVSEVHKEVCYSARLGRYTDGTWLQRMCCAYSDILSLYFGGRDELRFRGERGDEG